MLLLLIKKLHHSRITLSSCSHNTRVELGLRVRDNTTRADFVKPENYEATVGTCTPCMITWTVHVGDFPVHAHHTWSRGQCVILGVTWTVCDGDFPVHAHHTWSRGQCVILGVTWTVCDGDFPVHAHHTWSRGQCVILGVKWRYRTTANLPHIFGLYPQVKYTTLPLGFHTDYEPNEQCKCDLQSCSINAVDEPSAQSAKIF